MTSSSGEISQLIAGHATPRGTRGSAGRSELRAGLFLSPLGLGSRSGCSDGETDRRYAKLMGFALQSGINVFDTSPGFRDGRAEVAVGRALAAQVEAGLLLREQVVIIDKVGVLPSQGRPSLNRHEILPGGRSFEPGWIRESIQRSRRRFGLETIDIMLLEGPEWLRAHEPSRWEARLAAAFDAMEGARLEGEIVAYGVYSAIGVTRDHSDPLHLPIAEMTRIAKSVGGNEHGCRVLQTPMNALATAAFTHRTQQVSGDLASTMRAADECGLDVVVVAPFQHGAAFNHLDPRGRIAVRAGEETTELPVASWLLQFASSAPRVASCIFGTLDQAHLLEAATLANDPRWSFEEWTEVLY